MVAARPEAQSPEQSWLSVTQRFERLSRGFGPERWRLLGALASERKVAPSAIARLPELERVNEAWLERYKEEGLLVDAGVMHAALSLGSPRGERAIAIAPEFRALTLRRIAADGALPEVRATARALLGDRSLSSFLTVFYSGELGLIERALPELKYRLVADEAALFVRTALREAVCAPFDAAWFETRWRNEATRVAARILEDALITLEPVTELFDWALLRIEKSDEDEDGLLHLARVLAEHAALRGEPKLLRRATSRLPTAERLAWGVVSSYLEGSVEEALARSSESLSWQSKKPGRAALYPTALSTVLALSRAAEEASALAKSLARPGKGSAEEFVEGWPKAPTASALGRALRRLVRARLEREGEPERLDVHQFPPQTVAWELLITALTVHLSESSKVTRAAWAKRLLDGALAWNRAGYSRFALEALALSRALDPTSSLEGVRGLALFEPKQALLVGLLEKPPEWRKSLEALAAFSRRAEKSDAVQRLRVAWFVDMTHGELENPALEEFVDGTGWTRGRRVPFEELLSHADSLPREDREVLRVFAAAEEGESPSALALEALSGHPRVFNGARGRLPVEVIRASCRVETRIEDAHLVIAVTPARATPGVHWVVDGEDRLLVYRVSQDFAELARLLPADLRVPEAHATEALPILAELAEQVEVYSPKLLGGRSLAADATPCIRVSSDAGAFWVELGVRPFGKNGRFFPVREGSLTLTGYRDGAWVEVVRDFDAEALNLEALLGATPTLAQKRARELAEGGDSAGQSVPLSEEELFALLVELRESGTPCALEWKNTRAVAQRGSVTRTTLRGALRRTKGWYLVTGGVRLDEVTDLALAELVKLPFTKSGRFIRLPSGDFLEVEAHFRRVLTAIAANASSSSAPRASRASAASALEPSEVQVPDAAFGALAPLLEEGSGFDIDASVHAFTRSLETAFTTEYPIPEGLTATLRPYQLEGYRWLRRSSALGLGVVLADDMGLGKTFQVIALLLARASEGPALVVAPTSVCTNWIEELTRFAPSLRAREYAGKDRKKLLESCSADAAERLADVLVVSYGLLQQDTELFSGVVWNTAVLDEAQFIKNPGSLRAKAAFRLEANYRVAMTGTPVENHLGDLWSIFHFLNPTLLGPHKHFELSYMLPIERDKNSERREVLKNLVLPFVLRRTKDQVLRELPPITARAYEVRFSDDEAVRYAWLRKQIHDKLHDGHVKRERKLEVFAEIMRLRRFCCHPRLVFPEAPLESSKLQALLELVEELRDNGHRALVFSQFVDFLELVREVFAERGVRYQYLDGATPKEQRMGRVRAFQAGEGEVFLISLKAGGFGLNLTAADYVIHLDPWWNPAVEAQATDRAHRIGQSRPVTVYRLITKDSIEQRIVELHREKRALAEALLDGSDGAARLSADDLKALLS